MRGSDNHGRFCGGDLFACLADDRYNRLHWRYFSIRHPDFQQYAAGGGFHLVGNFVGRHFKQQLSLIHRFADFFKPLGDRTLGHCQPQLGHFDFCSHEQDLPSLHTQHFRQPQ